jgi:hypothetical protein
MGSVYQDVCGGVAGVMPTLEISGYSPTHALHPQRSRLAAAPKVIWGAFVFRGCCPFESRRDGQVFPVISFCVARQMLTTCMSMRRELGGECRFSVRRRLESLSLGTIRRLLMVNTGQWSRLSHAGARLVWHRGCDCSADRPFGTPRGGNGLPSICSLMACSTMCNFDAVALLAGWMLAVADSHGPRPGAVLLLG